jgi:SAM-dependent methyltransferase
LQRFGSWGSAALHPRLYAFTRYAGLPINKGHTISTNNHPAIKHLLSTSVAEHFAGREFPVYLNDDAAKAARIDMDWNRVSFTLDAITEQFSEPSKIKVLELGANPYFLTEMIQERFGAEIHTNGCPIGLRDEQGNPIRSGKVSFTNSTAARTIENSLFNVEEDRFPYDDRSFDLVICEELIEHLLFSPTFMLNEIHRVLKKGGKLILSCPNVARIDVLRAVLANKNPVWGYVRVVGDSSRMGLDWPGAHGVYGRHNREATLSEVTDLARGCGFRIVESKCVTFLLPKVCVSLRRPLVFFQTLTYRLMKSVTFLPIKFLRLKKDFVFLVGEKDVDEYVEYYPAALYDVWQVQNDEMTSSDQELESLNA